ncbi:MAG: glucose-6-phosphate isomerase [Ignavibacteriaceae bacterium]|nr:glucose-6-phosphate isomerase [Ignavibacteriaceae bacterium]
MNISSGRYQTVIEKTLNHISRERIIARIWQKDHTVWRNDPTEISNRLGWLDCIEVTKKSFGEIYSFVEEIKKEGFTDALLMGMGGSSLAPEVFRLTFGVKKGFLDLHVLDSTHPEAILDYEKKLQPEKTLYIVSTKSGGTVETMSFMKYFFTSVSEKLGREVAAQHFIAITDPGSGLEEIAKKLNFRKIFLNDPDIGGRFSALSLFGIVPAALIGIDIENLFDETKKMVDECKQLEVSENSGTMLGGIIGSLANEGVDKLTFIISPQLKYLGGWLEQLIAESTGKDGKGILPVDLEPSVAINEYNKDRVFVYLKLSADDFFDKKVAEIKAAGFPLIEIELKNIYQLGAEFFRWEFATAVASFVLDVQPFDQPNVESAKVAARAVMKEYQSKGKLPELKTKNDENNVSSFLSDIKSGKNYVAIQAYLKPDEKIWQELQQLRLKILQKYKVATTLGYGPRFLHSTGQLHKGDSGNGFFIQFISEVQNDAAIPEEAGSDKSSISFGTLVRAQALGDRQALIDNKRRVLTIDLGRNVGESLSKLLV